MKKRYRFLITLVFSYLLISCMWYKHIDDTFIVNRTKESDLTIEEIKSKVENPDTEKYHYFWQTKYIYKRYRTKIPLIYKKVLIEESETKIKQRKY